MIHTPILEWFLRHQDSEPVLYTIGCPQCRVLEKKLNAKGIPYQKETSETEMAALGIDRLPVLAVGGVLLGFTEANEWINKQ